MTGLSGNRLSIFALRFRIASPRVSIDLSCASVNRNSIITSNHGLQNTKQTLNTVAVARLVEC